MSAKQLIESVISEHVNVIQSLDTSIIEDMVEMVVDCYTTQAKLILFGNVRYIVLIHIGTYPALFINSINLTFSLLLSLSSDETILPVPDRTLPYFKKLFVEDDNVAFEYIATPVFCIT